IRSAISIWEDVTIENVHVNKICGAMTNSVFLIKLVNKNAPIGEILLRIYGHGIEWMFNRKRELEWIVRLSDCGICPKVYSLFSNGRLEEWVDGVTFTPNMMRDKFQSRKIANLLQQMHNSLSNEGNLVDELWDRLYDWRQKAKSICTDSSFEKYFD